MADAFAFLRSVTRGTAKMTIPSPSMLYLRGGRSAVSSAVYPDLAEFWHATSPSRISRRSASSQRRRLRSCRLPARQQPNGQHTQADGTQAGGT